MKELDNVVLFVIDQTSKMAKQHSQREFDLRRLGITVDQWVLLKIIEEKKELSQIELAKISQRDPASITRSLDLLQKKGLLKREAIPDNRRQYNITLTKEGKVFVMTHMGLVEELRSLSIKGLTKKEIQTLTGMLLKIQKNMK
jgi:MarR family transcriptional regulator for hemolysin